MAGPDGRIGLVVSLLAGALVPVMTGLLASEAIGRRVGGGRAVVAVPIAAAVIAALPGQLWQSSAVAMSDTLSVALATTGAWAACRYGRTGRTRWLLLAAATVAAAIDTRWVSGLVAVPIAAVALLGVRTVWRADRRRAIRDAGAAALVGAIVLAPVAVPMGLAVAGGTTVPFAADFGAYAWDPLERPADLVHDERRIAHLRDDERGVLPRPGRRALLVRTARPSRDLGRGLGRATRAASRPRSC